MKEISEINKKINLGQGGAAVAARLPAERPPPSGYRRDQPGLGMINELAPHLQRGGT